MELEELKNKWQKLSIRVERLENDKLRLAAELASGRANNARKSLVRFYYTSGIVGFSLPLLAIALIEVLHFQFWVAFLYATFGIIMAVLNLLFADYIKRNADTSLPVVEALRNMLIIRRRQRQLRILGITLGLVVVLSLFGQVTGANDRYILYGMIVGLCIGIPIGIYKELRMIRLARELQNELKNCHSEGLEE